MQMTSQDPLRSLLRTPTVTSYDIDLEARISAYWRWQVIEILRGHVLTVLRKKRLPGEEYCHGYLLQEKFINMGIFNPITDMSQLLKTVKNIVVKPLSQ